MRSFDRVARAYRWLEYLSFGKALVRAREQHLPALGAARRALVLGDGDGRFLAALLRRNPLLEAVAIDSSRRMLNLLAARCRGTSDRLSVRCADLRVCPEDLLRGEQAVDLVVTHFFFDCLSEDDLRALVAAVSPLLRPGGLWVISEFRTPPRGPLRSIAGLIIRTLYLAFHLLTGLSVTRVPDYTTALTRSGLRLQSRRLRLGGLLVADLWRMP